MDRKAQKQKRPTTKKKKTEKKKRNGCEAEKNCIILYRTARSAAAAALFIFKSANMIEESARKRQHVEYIASLKCGRSKKYRGEDHIDRSEKDR